MLTWRIHCDPSLLYACNIWTDINFIAAKQLAQTFLSSQTLNKSTYESQIVVYTLAVSQPINKPCWHQEVILYNIIGLYTSPIIAGVHTGVSVCVCVGGGGGGSLSL